MNTVEKRLDELDFSQPLSLRNILRRSYVNDKQINKNLMLYTLHKSKKYRNVKPIEVGSGKHRLNVWGRI